MISSHPSLGVSCLWDFVSDGEAREVASCKGAKSAKFLGLEIVKICSPCHEHRNLQQASGPHRNLSPVPCGPINDMYLRIGQVSFVAMGLFYTKEYIVLAPYYQRTRLMGTKVILENSNSDGFFLFPASR